MPLAFGGKRKLFRYSLANRCSSRLCQSSAQRVYSAVSAPSDALAAIILRTRRAAVIPDIIARMTPLAEAGSRTAPASPARKNPGPACTVTRRQVTSAPRVLAHDRNPDIKRGRRSGRGRSPRRFTRVQAHKSRSICAVHVQPQQSAANNGCANLPA